MKITMQKLNKHLFPLLVALVLVVGMCYPITASADKWYDPIDYRDLDYKVIYGAEFNKVVVPLPASHFYLAITDKAEPNKNLATSIGTGQVSFDFVKGKNYIVGAYPGGNYGFSLDGMPVGTQLHFDLLMTVHSAKEIVLTAPDLYARSFYRTSSGFKNVKMELLKEDYIWGSAVHMDFFVTGYEGATSYVPLAYFDALSGYDYAELTVVMSNVYLEMDVSVDYWAQWQQELNGKKLDAISDGLEDVQDGLYDVEDAVNNSADRVTGAISNSTDKITDAVTGAADEAAKDILNGNALTDNIASESNDEMSAAAGKLDNLGNQLNSVEKPNINTFKVGIGDMIGDTTSIPMLTAPIREIWESPVALGIMTIVITLVLVSWVFFGKKK